MILASLVSPGRRLNDGADPGRITPRRHASARPTMEETWPAFLGGAMVSQQRAAGRPALTPDRDPVIDLARFFCLVLVVVGHTMMVSPVLHPDGTVTSENTLGNQHWFEPVVWVLQIMPLFFVAGGITGLQSWRRLRARGGNASDFMQVRLLRLIRPAAVLLAVMFTGLSLALLSGVDPQVIQLLTSGAGMPLWFLAAYLAAQLNLPWLAALHARAPWLTLAGLTSLVVAVDCLRGVLPMLAYLNMVFLWCAVQQLGFIVADSRPLQPSRPALFGIYRRQQRPAGAAGPAGAVLREHAGKPQPAQCDAAAPGHLAGRRPPALPAGAGTHRDPGLGAPGGGRGRTAVHDRLFVAPAPAGGDVRAAAADRRSPAGRRERGMVVGAAAGAVGRHRAAAAGTGAVRQARRAATAPGPAPSRPAAAVLLAAVAVFVPAVHAAFNGLTLGLLGGGAACFALAVVLLGRIPARLTASADRPGGSEPPLPRPPLSANVEP